MICSEGDGVGLARGGVGGWDRGCCGGFEVIGFHRVEPVNELPEFGPSVLPDGSVFQPNPTANPALAPRVQS